MKKQFFRVKQLADQTFLKAEKSKELNSDELQIADQKVEFLRAAITAINKRLPNYNQGLDTEKRTKKCPEYQLANIMYDHGGRKSNDSSTNTLLDDECLLFQDMLRECALAQQNLAREYGEHESKVEEMVSSPLQNLLDNEFPNIAKHKRNLSKYILDKDSASNRYHSTRKETLKDDMEEADSKVEQSRDTLANEMFGLLAKENEVSTYVLQLLKLQRGYHESALKMLDDVIPRLEQKIANSKVRPVFGTSLQEHLHVTGKTIALPLEICISVLSKLGMSEEGLFRIGGSVLRVKRLRASIDSGCFTAITPEYADVHVLASTLKMYLRELPEPLFTYKLHNDWLYSMQLPDGQRLSAANEFVAKLPIENYNNLSFLIRFLAQLSRHPENKMTTANIAIVMAPNLLWNEADKGALNMENCAIYNTLVDFFIREVDNIFPHDVVNLGSFNVPVNVTPPLKGVNHFDTAQSELRSSPENVLNDSPRPNTRRRKPIAPVPPVLSDSKPNIKSPASEEDQQQNDITLRLQNTTVGSGSVVFDSHKSNVSFDTPSKLVNRISSEHDGGESRFLGDGSVKVPSGEKPTIPTRPRSTLIPKRPSLSNQVEHTHCSVHQLANRHQTNIVTLRSRKVSQSSDEDPIKNRASISNTGKDRAEPTKGSQMSHARTKSDGNIVDINNTVSRPNLSNVHTSSIQRNLNKPTQPPPPPPVSNQLQQHEDTPQF